VALKKPSDFFDNNKKTPLDEVKESIESARPEKIEQVSEAFDAFKSNLNHLQSLNDFTSTFDSFKSNLEKVENVSSEINEIKSEIKNLIKKEDLDSAIMAQLLFVEESISKIESKVSSINGKTVDSIREDFVNLSDTVNGFLSVDVPKYKKLIAESEVRTDSRFATYKEGIEENLDKIKVEVNKEVETALESIESINENTINIVKAEVKETVGDVNKKVNELVEKELPKYKKLFAETEVKTEEKINSAIHSYKSTIESLSGKVKQFTEEEIPKYSNFLIETKLKSEKEVKKLEEEVLSRVKTLSEKVESLSEDVEQKTFERVESLQDVVKEYKEEIESISKRYETLQKDFTGRVVHEDKKLNRYSKKLDEFSKRFSFIEETLTEDVRELKENLETNTSKFYAELKSEIDNVEQNIAQTVKDLEVNIVINETHLKKQNEYIGNIQEEVKEVLDKLQLDVLEKKNAQLVERINHVEEVFSKINEKTLLTEDNPTLPGDPSTNNSGDPLTPLDQKFVTLDQLQNHYRIFINRIQQQIATIGGGGEVRLEFLDDVDRDSVKVDGKFLKYQASSGKFIGADASGGVGAGGTWATFDSNTGITTTKKVKIDNDLEVTGVTTSTGGFVGNVTGTATGLSSTPDISIRNITGVAATFTGVLTYEDVTNIDSIGLITARTGVNVLAGGVNVSGVSTFSGDISIADKIVHTGDTNTAIRFPAADTITAETAGSERLRITSDGKFGFGTNANIDERGHIETASGNCRLKIQTGDATVAGFVLQTSAKRFDVQAQNNFFQIYDNSAATERLRITSDGDVGIGTDNPQKKLHVSGTSDFVVDTDSSALRFGSYGEYDIALVTGRNTPTDSSRLYIENGDGEALRITSSGNIGIGEGSPSAILHVTKAGDPNIIQENSANNSLDRNNTHSFQYSDGEGAFVKATRPSSGSASDTYLAFGSGGSTERVRIDSSGRLLIGTTTEGNELADNITVADTGNCGITIRSGSSSYGSIYFSDATSGGGEYAGQIEYLHSSDRFTFYAGVSAIMRVHSDKVDILGHTETDTLNVSGVSTFSGDVSIADKIVHTGDTDTAIRFPATNRFAVETGGIEALRVDGSQRVGIGTNDLQARFTVYSAENSSYTREIRVDASDAPSGSVGHGLLRFLGDGNSLGKYIIAYNSTHPSQPNDISLKNSDGDISFHNAVNGTPAEKLRITTTGRIGINESNPAYTLDLGESSSTIRLVSENNGTAIRVGAGGGSNDVTLIRVDGDSSNHDGESDSAEFGFSLKYLGSGSQNANAFAIFSDNQTGTQVQAFTVLQDGTVGINSTLPSERLDVGGTTKTEQLNVSGLSTFTGSISFPDSSGDTVGRALFGDSDDLRIYHDGNNSIIQEVGAGDLRLAGNVVKLNNGGNTATMLKGTDGGSVELNHNGSKKFETTSTGIDVTGHTETDTLNVSGISTFSGDISIADKIIHTGDTNTAIRFPASDTFTIETAGSERLRIDSNGDVGVGIADPQERLHVARTVMITGNTPQIRLNANDSDASDGDRTMLGQATGNGNFVTTAVDNDTILRGTSTGSLLFGIGTVERFRIASTGNIGINKTSPAEKLDVGGITKTEGLNVTGTSSFTGAITANGNISMFSAAPQFILKEDGSTYGSTHWALVRDSDSFSIRWNNAAPYALRATTSGGSVGSVFLRQSQLEVNASGAVIQGSLSKGSGSFKIDHPLVGMSTTHNLVHSFIEGPQADLIYRGKVDLVNGSATVNIDTAGRMTEGTFVALCTNVQCFTTNETDWTAIKGSVSGNTLTVLAQDSSCTATVSWMVVGERKDQHMIDTNWTDDNGRVITEPPKTD